jgi:hypothetical protein
MRIEKALAQAEARANQLQKEVDVLFTERDNSFRTHETQYNRMVAVIERLTILEDKLFPNMGPMLDRIENVVGSFDKWHMNNPLDRREKNGPPVGKGASR